MRILIDPIPTGQINRCASTVKVLRCVEHTLKNTDDVFFYWMIPEDISEEEREWLPKSDRIAYIPMNYFEDRYKEYWLASDAWRRAVAFNGDYWDIDMVLTNRTSLVPFLKWALQRPGGMLEWSKRVFLLEDMPIMSFKMFIPQSTVREGDLATLNGYLSANTTCISAYWEKKHIIDIGRKYLSAASLRYLTDNIIEAGHHVHTTPKLKHIKDVEPLLKGERKFTVSYAGRMVNRDFVDDSFDILLKHWIFGGDDVKMILCTVSKDFGRVNHPAIKLIDVRRPNREEFWRIMREEADIGVFMSRDEDYSMVMMEPLMQGTPLVIYEAEHAVASVGPDYPFFVKSVKEGYAIVKQFKENYPKMYSIFAKWSQTHFAKLLEERNKQYIPDYFLRDINQWKEDLGKNSNSLPNNEVVQLIASRAIAGQPFSVVETIKQLEKEKKIRGSIAGKIEDQYESLRLTFSTHFDVYRVGLLKMGFKDAGPTPGLMVKPE